MTDGWFFILIRIIIKNFDFYQFTSKTSEKMSSTPMKNNHRRMNYVQSGKITKT